MINLKSKTLQNYYGEYPDDYNIKFIHHNIDIFDEFNTKEEYEKLKEDFDNIYKYDKKSFLLYFSDIDNYLKVLSHIDIHELYNDKIYLRIRDISEYERLKKYDKLKKVKIIIDLKDIEKLNIKDYNLVIQLDKVKDLSINELDKLLKKYNIVELLLGQMNYLNNSDKYLVDAMSKMYDVDPSKIKEIEYINKITNDIYSVNMYKRIYYEINNILKSLDIKDKEDGLYKIFYYIANNINYSDLDLDETDIDNQNLINVLFNKRSVCEGYSKLLMQMLSIIDIDSILVQGGGDKKDGGHIWNQIYINNKWYNADVTSASYNIINNIKVNTFLVKDDDLSYKAISILAHRCNDNYSINNVVKRR